MAKAVFPIVRKDHLFSLLYPPHNSSAAEHAVMLGNADRLILFVMRDQAAVPALLDEDLAVDNENTDLTDIDGVAFFNKHLVSVMVGRFHAVTADRNHEVRLFRFFGFGNKNPNA